MKHYLFFIKNNLIQIITLCILFNYSIISAQSNNFTTYYFDAQIEDNQTLNAEVEAAIDDDGNIHIAWIRTINEVSTVMHTLYNPITKIITTVEVDPSITADRKVMGGITTKNNIPYIVYMIRRDNDGGTKTGNFAVLLASGNNGDNSFNVEQVSTNPEDPDTNSEDLYSCYVNGRPNVFYKGSNLIINYIADANSNTDWDNYMIFATRSGSGWNYTQEFNTDGDMEGTYDVYSGTAIALDDTYTYGGFIEVSNYSVRYLYKSTDTWTNVEIGDYGSTFDNENIQIVSDNDSNAHLFWYNEEDDKFCHTVLNAGSYSEVVETYTGNSAGGNFMPATIDKSLKTPVYYYKKSYSDGHLLILDEDDQYTDYTISKSEIGVTFGRTSLFADNGVVFLVTASEDDAKIYITSNFDDTANDIETTSNKTQPFKIYPNPVNDSFRISSSGTLDIFNSTGVKIKSMQVEADKEINCEDLYSGIYFYVLYKDQHKSVNGSFIKK